MRKLRSLQFYDTSRLPELAGLSPAGARSVIVTEVYRGPYQLLTAFLRADEQGFGSWHVEFLDSLAASLSHSIGHLQTVSELSEAQTQLMHAERLAAIGQLAAGVAHEINNPVGFVASNFRALGDYVADVFTLVQKYRQQHDGKGLADLEQDLDLDFDSMIADIENLLVENADGLERITEIVRSLRTFARLDQPADRAPNDLNTIVADTLIIANHELRNVARVQTVFGDVPDVVCHASQINQVFLNILVNAAHAIRSQERPELGLISVRTGHDDGGAWCTISDDGPGIAVDIAPRVFEPFFTTKAVGEGTGLGLAIAYDIVVNKHGGAIAVEPADRGTTFRVRLPLAGAPALR
jgi:signal transduction histidine kinase